LHFAIKAAVAQAGGACFWCLRRFGRWTVTRRPQGLSTHFAGDTVGGGGGRASNPGAGAGVAIV
jgi:hypothetical protein